MRDAKRFLLVVQLFINMLLLFSVISWSMEQVAGVNLFMEAVVAFLLGVDVVRDQR